MKQTKNILVVILVILSSYSYAQNTESIFGKFETEIYGVVNYYNFDWDTAPEKRNAFDTERLNLI